MRWVRTRNFEVIFNLTSLYFHKKRLPRRNTPETHDKTTQTVCQKPSESLECASFIASQILRESSMANSAQARKRARQSVKQNAHNSSLRSELRTAVKKVLKAIEAGDKAAAQAVYQASVSTVDSIADKKIIHKNKASRHKSRLSAAIKAMA
jgi:small subunit ribosomal protein S20